jgi:hypothetical protein
MKYFPQAAEIQAFIENYAKFRAQGCSKSLFFGHSNASSARIGMQPAGIRLMTDSDMHGIILHEPYRKYQGGALHGRRHGRLHL